MRLLTRPADDPAALRRYLEVLLRQAGAVARGAPQRKSALRLAPGETGPPAVPLAYAAWIEHLFYLEALLGARLELGLREIFPEERRGLELLREARASFWQRHELCACGALLERGGTCALCSLQFARQPARHPGALPAAARTRR